MKYLFIVLALFSSCVHKQEAPTEASNPRGEFLGCEIICILDDGGTKRTVLRAEKYDEVICLENKALECVMRAVYENDKFYKLNPTAL